MSDKNEMMRVESGELSVKTDEKLELRPKKESFVQKYIGGEVFTKKTVTKQLPFVIYVVLLLMLYITNTYIAEDVNSELMVQNRVLENKHVEYVYNKSEITKLTKQSQLVKLLKDRGIKESVEPLKKITIYVGQNKKD